MIHQQIRDAVATVVVDDFGPLSRYDAGFATALRDTVVDLADSDSVKVVVLRAVGPDFCPADESSAGSAGPWPASGEDIWTTWDQDFAGSRSLYQSLCFSKKVIVTEVSGACTGAGSMLVLCSDLTVADDNASFRSPFSSIPEANVVLAALTMRLNRAKSWLLQDSTLSAAEALDAGLVNEVVHSEDLLAAVARMTHSVTRMPLDGVTMSKMLLQSVLDAQGVGREFDMAGFYAAAKWQDRPLAAGGASQ
jgi:enoyl-CoA hydratase/carnithine racemase